VNAPREIRHYQKQAGTIFSRAEFMRLVKELFDGLRTDVMHVSASGHASLQHCTEAYIVTYFEMMYHILVSELNESSNRAAIHAGRQTIFVKDSVFIQDGMRIVDAESPLARDHSHKDQPNSVPFVGSSRATTGGKGPRKSVTGQAKKGATVTKRSGGIKKPAATMGLPPTAAKRLQNERR
jgi:histone H3/H4